MNNNTNLLLKLSGIIVYIIGILFCITIIGIIIGIPLIMGGNKFIRYSNMNLKELKQYKDSILIWSILFLIFSFIIPGVLGLIAFLHINGTINIDDISINQSVEQQLAELDRLKQNNIISEDEYNQKRKKILEI